MKITIFLPLFLLSLPCFLLADAEERVTAFILRDSAFKNLELKYHNRKQSGRLEKDKDPMGEWRCFIDANKGTYEAGLAGMAIIDYYLWRNDFAAALKEAETVAEANRKFDDLYIKAIWKIRDIVRRKELPEDLRKKGVAFILTHCEGNGFVLSDIYGLYKDDISWKKMMDCAKLAGKDDPVAMETVFRYLTDSRKKVSSAEYVSMEREFEDFYGKDNRMDCLLSIHPEKHKEYRQALEALRKNAMEIKAALNGPTPEKGLPLLRQWKNYPEQARTVCWNVFAGDLYKKLPSDDKLLSEYVFAAFDIIPAGNTRQGIANSCVHNRKSKYDNPKRTAELLAKYFQAPPGKALTLHNLNFNENARIGETYPAMAEIAKKYEFSDYASMLLFKAAREVWDSDEAKAKLYLRQAIGTAPDSQAAAFANWWLSFMEGKESFLRGPLPRKVEFGADILPPSIPVPACMAVPAPSPVKEKNGRITLPKLPREVGTDFVPWTPEKVLAEKIVSLKQISTIAEIRIVTADNLHFTIELCDADGRILRLYERAWPYGELLHRPFAPKEENRMTIRPCDNVAFVRLRIFAKNLAEDGVRSLTLLPPTYPLTGLFKEQTAKCEPSIRSVTLSLQETPAEQTVSLTRPDSCQTAPRPRWEWPWGTTNLFSFFGGSSFSVEVIHAGTLHYVIDSKTDGSIVKRSGAPKNNEPETYPLPNPGTGFHSALFYTTALLPKENNKQVVYYAAVKALKIQGTARALPCVRFKVNGEWTPFLTGKEVSVPAKTTEYQGGIFFDSRSVAGQVSASANNLSIVPVTQPGQPGAKLCGKDAEAITDDVKALAEYVTKYRPAVVFPRNGTQEEYELAKKIAEKAGCFLVPDDVGTGSDPRMYEGPFLAIGTPFTSRLVRQLAMRRPVWEDPVFLNSTEGFCGILPEEGGLDGFGYATGHTHQAVLNAAKRLLSALEPFRAQEPYRLFGQSMVKHLHPWQLHPERAPLKELDLILARHDRRNISFGIAYERDAGSVKVEVSPLRKGKDILPAPRVRFVGFYDQVQCFGALRMADILVDKPLLPAPALTSQRVVLTVRTDVNTPPGLYTGTVKVDIDGTVRNLPFHVEVVNGVLPHGSLNFNDYAVMPYYYHDTPRMRKDFAALLGNMAEHGVNMPIIKGEDSLDWTIKGNSAKFDFTRTKEMFDLADREFTKAGMPPPQFFYTVPQRTLSFIASQERIPEEKVFAEYARQFRAFLDKNKLYDRVWCSLGDEVTGVIDQWVKTAKIFKDGGLRIWVTHAHEKMDAVNAAWCPNWEHKVLDMPQIAEALRTKKKPVWWYTCGGGGPTQTITRYLHYGLPVYWITAKWRLDGAFYNAGLHTSEWGYPIPFRRAGGWDTLVYFLPDGTLLDSIRREVQSEGIHDALLLKARRDAPGTEEILAEIVPFKWGFERNPANWDKARKKIYETWKNDTK